MNIPALAGIFFGVAERANSLARAWGEKGFAYQRNRGLRNRTRALANAEHVGEPHQPPQMNIPALAGIFFGVAERANRHSWRVVWLAHGARRVSLASEMRVLDPTSLNANGKEESSPQAGCESWPPLL
jgi:hypothetical protein